MIELEAKVQNGAGIHCRPSTLIVERVREYEGELCVRARTRAGRGGRGSGLGSR
jgi:phosphotransferase system HPr-like phosphotransfer protein